MREGRHCQRASMARRLLGCALVLGVLLVVNTAEATVLRQHYEFAEPAVEVVDGT